MRLIAWYREHGAKLVNQTNGGEGTLGWHGNKGNKRPDLAARNRAGRGKPGHPSTPETKAKISAAHKGRKAPWLAERNRLGKGNPGHPHTAESRAKIGLAHRGKQVPEVARRKQSVTMKGLWAKKKATGQDWYRNGHHR